MNPDSHDLIQRHMTGLLTDDEATVLQTRLKADTDLRRLYLHYMNLDVALEAQAGSQDRVIDLLRAAPLTENKPAGRWFSWRPLTAAAACVALIGAVAAIFMMKRDGGVRVQIVHAEEARIEGHGDLLRVGEQFAVRELRLEGGMLRLRLPTGVLLDLHAPLTATLDSAMRMHLREGRMNADVGKDGKGFTVITDAGEIVDLGTRFGVEAEQQGESRVAVFSGQVKVRNASAGGAFTTLHVGEAVKFTALVGLQSWQQVALAANAAGIGQSQPGSLIETVRDNRGDEQLHPFYGVMRQGVQPRAQVYVDRLRVRLAPKAGDTIPHWLIGADLILTYQRFRNHADYELTLTLNEAATIFVMLPEHRAPPKWLTDGYVNTGAQVAVGPVDEDAVMTTAVASDEPATPRRIFAIWRADVAAGKHVLGGLRDDQSPDKSRVSYSIAIKPRDPQR